VKYTGDATDGISSVKRLYVDIAIVKPCPQCGENVEHDFNESYISYGEVSAYFYCDNCEYEWEVEADVTATVTIELKE
jgi:hypothetical protein